LRGNVAANELVAGGKDDLVAFDAEGTIENDGVAAAVVAFHVFVGFEDRDAALTIGGYGTRQRNLDEAGVGIGIGHERIFAGFATGDDFEMKRISGHGIDNGFVAGGAALANGIVEILRAGCGGGDFVIDLEAGGLGREKFVAGVFVGFAVAAGNFLGM
jgi:hypothetical protein